MNVAHPPLLPCHSIDSTALQICRDQAELTKALLDRSVKLNSHILAFLNDLTKLLGRHAVKGQKEMRDLSEQLPQLAHHIEQ